MAAIEARAAAVWRVAWRAALLKKGGRDEYPRGCAAAECAGGVSAVAGNDERIGIVIFGNHGDVRLGDESVAFGELEELRIVVEDARNAIAFSDDARGEGLCGFVGNDSICAGDG